jgi:hypothetical protein
VIIAGGAFALWRRLQFGVRLPAKPRPKSADFVRTFASANTPNNKHQAKRTWRPDDSSSDPSITSVIQIPNPRRTLCEPSTEEARSHVRREFLDAGQNECPRAT